MKKALILVFLMGITLVVLSQNGISRHKFPSGSKPWLYFQRNEVVLDNSSNKWVCFQSGGIARFDGTNWNLYDPSNSPLPSYLVYCVTFDAGNKAWIGTDSGAVSFDGTNWIRYNTRNSGITSNKVLSVVYSNGKLVFGTDRGISILTGSTWLQHNTANSGLVSDTVNALVYDGSGSMWAATARGVSKLQGATWTSYTHSNSILKESAVNSLFADPAGQVWAGTSAQLYRITGNTITTLSVISPPPLAVVRNSDYSICMGAHGGIAFGAGIGTSSNSGLNEIGWPKNFLYHVPIPKKICFEKSTGKYWFTTSQPIDTVLFSFDPTQYNPAWLGLNYENIKALDINQVRAPVLTSGDMHWDGVSAGYEVPIGSGKHADFAASLWIGGLDQAGTLHQAAMTYRQSGFDYWPGPLDTLSGSTDSSKAASYDKIWKVDRYKIEEFKYYFQNGMVQNGTYMPQEDIITWPGNGQGNFSRNLAPYVDVNHNGLYDPLTGGDYPLIQGDQELYRIFNDQLAIHTETGGTKLNVEVHATTYAYDCPSVADSDKVLNYTTFYHYEVFNRSSQNYTQVYLGGWQDTDLGNYSDDMVGCSPSGNYGYVYNGALCDGAGGSGEYGCNPPMMSTVVLDGPLAVPGDGIDNNNNGVIDEPGEKNLMTVFHYYDNDAGPYGNPGFGGNISGPRRPMDYYNYLLGKWCDSSFVTYGGRGYGGITPTRFMYPDFPYDTSGWSEASNHNTPGDRRFVIGCGPFNLNAGNKVNFDYALVFTRDTLLAPQSKAFFQKNASDNQKVKNWYAQNNSPSCLDMNVGIREPKQFPVQLEVYPNPFSDELTIDFASGSLGYSAELIDLTGKTVLEFMHLQSGAHVLNMSGLSEGMYFLKVRDATGVSCQKIIKR